MKRIVSMLVAGAVGACSAVTAGAVRAEEKPAAPKTELTQSAQEQVAQCERQRQRKAGGALSENAYRQLERIYTAIGKGEYAESEKKLNELLGRVYGDYEKATVLQGLAFVYAQTNRNAQAIKTFQDVLALNALPPQQQDALMLNIGQLLIADDKYDEGIQQMEAYMAQVCNSTPDAHILLAAAYAEKKRYRDSLAQVDKALAKVKTPKEAWLQFKLALHFELNEYPKCAEVLLRLVALAPQKADYWKQLSGMLFQIQKDPEALAVLALADRQGYISQAGEFRNLANLYLYLQIPYKAARVLQRGLDQKVLEPDDKLLEQLSNAWLMAREYDKAQDAMKKAAALSDRGELWKRLGQIYMEQEHWKSALEAFNKATQKGGVKEPGELALLTGIAAMQSGDHKRAGKAFQLALGYEGSRKSAAQWLEHLRQTSAEAEANSSAPNTNAN